MTKPAKTKAVPINPAPATPAQPPAPERNSMEITFLPVDSLVPNTWNTNRMSEDIQNKLTAYLKREGLVEPIIVRPHGDKHQIIGGYHRWKICKERLGYTEIPCVVLSLDDRRAKILSVNLNEMSGQPVPALLSELLHELSKETALDDLATQLPYTVAQMEDSLELLKLPDGLEAYIEEQAAKEKAEAPVIVTVVLDQDQAKVFEEAVAKAIGTAGKSKNSRGKAVEMMARALLDSMPTAAAPTVTPAA